MAREWISKLKWSLLFEEQEKNRSKRESDSISHREADQVIEKHDMIKTEADPFEAKKKHLSDEFQ